MRRTETVTWESQPIHEAEDRRAWLTLDIHMTDSVTRRGFVGIQWMPLTGKGCTLPLPRQFPIRTQADIATAMEYGEEMARAVYQLVIVDNA